MFVDGARRTRRFSDWIWQKFHIPNLRDGKEADKQRHKRFDPV